MITPSSQTDILAPESLWLQQSENAMLKHLYLCGYELVYPSLMESYDALKKIGGRDLVSKINVMVDPFSGEWLCVRPDMTPQIARIDRTSIEESAVQRFCYSGPVFVSIPSKQGEPREPWQIGAEILGCNQPMADLEIIQLSVECLALVVDKPLYLELANPQLVRAILKALLDRSQRHQVMDIYKRKSYPDLAVFGESLNNASVMEVLDTLLNAHGDWDQFASLAKRLNSLLQAFETCQQTAISQGIEDLLRLGAVMAKSLPERMSLGYDLSDKISYEYHTGVVFGMYGRSDGTQLLRGGRYARQKGEHESAAATGMSMDLRKVYRYAQPQENASAQSQSRLIGIAADRFVPFDAKLQQKILQLRQAGNRVVRMYDSSEEGFERTLQRQKDGSWALVQNLN